MPNVRRDCMQKAQARASDGNPAARIPGRRSGVRSPDGPLSERRCCLSACSRLPARLRPANRESDSLRARAADQLYNLDRDLAVATYREAIAADPEDAGAYRGLASGLWLSITFRRGNMTVDDYVGRATRPSTPPQPPPPETAAAFRDAIDHALLLAHKRIDRNPRDADAHYQVGTAVALRASYSATVDASLLGAFRSGARGLRGARARHGARCAPQGRRAHRRHLSLRRRHPRAAAAMGRLPGGVRRRQGERAAAGRRGRGVSQRQPGRCAVSRSSSCTTANGDTTMR